MTASLWVPHCHPLFSAKTVSSLRAPIISYIQSLWPVAQHKGTAQKFDIF